MSGLLRQALLVAVTAIVVAFIIPSYLKPSYPVPEIFGTVAPGFEEVREAFRKNYEDHWDNREAGSAFSVYFEGEKVVDLWAGYADLKAKRLWKEDTMTMVFSTTKGLAALCVAMLVERGHLDLKKPVAYYWPEFGQHGKEKITVEQLTEHEAGLVATSEPLSFELLEDHPSLDKVLAESKPMWEPETRHGYHAITIGPYLDALVRRVDPKKRTIGRFFDEEVTKPFGIDAYIGVPFELAHRTARCINLQGTLAHTIYAFQHMPFMKKKLLSMIPGCGGESKELFKKLVDNCADVCKDYVRWADPDIRKIEIASVAGVATASALAKLFGILANGGKQGNQTLLSKGIIDEYANDKRGLTPDLVLYDLLMRWKYGMDVIPQAENEGNLFGAPGAGGQIGYADPNRKIGYGFVTRYMSPIGLQMMDPRIQNLKTSVEKAVHKIKSQ